MVNFERPAAVALAIFVAATLAAALGGSLSTIDAVDQYQTLEQPSWAPPSWLFGPVWSVLYVMIAAAGFLAWRATGWSSLETKLWFVQMVLNGFWSPLFFAWELRLVALGWIVGMAGFILWLILRLRSRQRVASWLLVPYFAWVCFATCLNAAVWWLNR